VVGFSGTYHVILERPAYAKFMAVPNYTYLNLKIPGPKGIITVGPMYQRAYECDIECFQFAEETIRLERLHAKDVKDAVISDGGRTICIGTMLDSK
jgi:hypothetical protein